MGQAVVLGHPHDKKQLVVLEPLEPRVADELAVAHAQQLPRLAHLAGLQVFVNTVLKRIGEQFVVGNRKRQIKIGLEMGHVRRKGCRRYSMLALGFGQIRYRARPAAKKSFLHRNFLEKRRRLLS